MCPPGTEDSLVPGPARMIRLITSGRRLRSAALLSGGTSGWATKTKTCASAWTASDSRKGRQRASRRLSRASWALRRCFSGCLSDEWVNVNTVNCLGPPGQPGFFGVEGLQVVNVSQQMGPAALLGAVVVVVGGVEVAGQHAGKLLAQDLIHHGLAPSPPQSLGGRAEGPHVASPSHRRLPRMRSTASSVWALAATPCSVHQGPQACSPCTVPTTVWCGRAAGPPLAAPQSG